MSYLKIKNKGLIETDALVLIGASSKRDDSTKIGMFGSGNKYALAYLIKNNFNFKIFSGFDEIKIDVINKEFRDNQFGVIYINGEKTSLTTEMGPDWELWQAIREIYCNAIDESEEEMVEVENIDPKENETHFYIEINEKLKLVLSERDNYFANEDKVLFKNKNGSILTKSGGDINLYRKGIRCYDSWFQGAFDYNFEDISINESRVIKYEADASLQIWGLILSCNNKEVIKKILKITGNTNYFESNCYSNITTDPSKEFIEVSNELLMAPYEGTGLLDEEEIKKATVVPSLIFRKIHHELKDEALPKAFKKGSSPAYHEFEPSEAQNNLIQECLLFLENVKFEIPYLIKTAIIPNKHTMGLADNGSETIIISDVCLEKGKKYIINTIIEEYIHLKHNVRDLSRGFQEASIFELINYMEKMNNVEQL